MKYQIITKICSLSVALVMWVFQPAQADPVTEGIECLQAQLNDLGENVGEVDGAFGQKTRTAIDRLRQSEKFADLPDANGGNSMVLCRLLAEIDSKMSAHFPASEMGAHAIIGNNLNRGTAVLAKRHFDQTIKELFEHIGYKLPLNINFIFSADLTELIDASYAAFDGQVSKQRLSDSLSQLCPGKSLDGAMSPTLIVVCGHAFDPNSGAGRLPVRDLRILIAHEAVHDIQHQLSGPVMKDAQPTPRGLGERWIKEAVAQAIALEVIDGADAAQEAAGELTQEELAAIPTLLEKSSYAKTDYNIGAKMVWRLTNGRSAVEALAYFENLGLGMRYADAFETAFGVSMTSISNW